MNWYSVTCSLGWWIFASSSRRSSGSIPLPAIIPTAISSASSRLKLFSEGDIVAAEYYYRRKSALRVNCHEAEVGSACILHAEAPSRPGQPRWRSKTVRDAAVGMYSRAASRALDINSSWLSASSTMVSLVGVMLFSGHNAIAVAITAITIREAAMMTIYFLRFFSGTLGSCCSSMAGSPSSYSLPNSIMVFLPALHRSSPIIVP